MLVGDISRRQANTCEISDIFHFTAIHFLPERHSAMVLIGELVKRARHSQVCSIENRGYIYILHVLGMCSFQHKMGERASVVLICITRNVLLSAQMGERASVVLICIITSHYNEVK